MAASEAGSSALSLAANSSSPVLTRSTTMRAGWPASGSRMKDFSISTGPLVSSTMRERPSPTGPKRNALTRPNVRGRPPAEAGRHRRQVDHHPVGVGQHIGGEAHGGRQIGHEAGAALIARHPGGDGRGRACGLNRQPLAAAAGTAGQAEAGQQAGCGQGHGQGGDDAHSGAGTACWGSGAKARPCRVNQWFPGQRRGG